MGLDEQIAAENAFSSALNDLRIRHEASPELGLDAIADRFEAAAFAYLGITEHEHGAA